MCRQATQPETHTGTPAPSHVDLGDDYRLDPSTRLSLITLLSGLHECLQDRLLQGNSYMGARELAQHLSNLDDGITQLENLSTNQTKPNKTNDSPKEDNHTHNAQ